MTSRHRWTDAERAYLRQHYADTLTADIAVQLGVAPSRVLAMANALGLHKSPAMVAETARVRTLAPGHGSHATRIKPGEKPWNTGLKGVTGMQHACRVTQFKPGNKPHTWVPVGSYRVNADNNLDRKVSEDGGVNERWKPVHRLVWVAANGPVPAGHLVVFKPGRHSTDVALITLDAIELITRAENMRRNSYHTNYPAELCQVVQLRGQLTRTINRKAKEAAGS